MPPKARQLWQTKSPSSKKPFVEDATWLATYAFQASNKTTILFKAGNKDYGLSASTEDRKTKTSELQLKKKYA